MSEHSKRTRGIITTGAVIGALLGGSAEAKSIPVHGEQATGIEQVDGKEKLLSMAEVTALEEQRLKSGEIVRYWPGRVLIPQPDGSIKFLIHPLLVPRTSPNSHKPLPDEIDNNHFAFGYIDHPSGGAHGKKHPRVVFVPYQPGDKFLPDLIQPFGGEASFDVVRGVVDFDHPINPANGKPLMEDGAPLVIGGVNFVV